MGYFPVRYDSRVVIYDRRAFIRLATGVIWSSHFNDQSVHNQNIKIPMRQYDFVTVELF